MSLPEHRQKLVTDLYNGHLAVHGQPIHPAKAYRYAFNRTLVDCADHSFRLVTTDYSATLAAVRCIAWMRANTGGWE